MDSRPPIYKICMIGDPATGKSSLLNCIKGDDFILEGEQVSTIGVDFWCKYFPNPERIIQIWDTAGCEKFLSITKTYFRRCNMAVYCCDLSDYSTLENIENWKERVEKECVNTDNLVGVLVALKSDLKRDSRYTETSVAEAAYSHGFKNFFVISNKSREGVNKFKEFIFDIPLSKFEKYRTISTPLVQNPSKKKNDCCNI